MIDLLSTYPYEMTSFEHAVEQVVLTASPSSRVELDEILVAGSYKTRPLMLAKWVITNMDSNDKEAIKAMLSAMKAFNKSRADDIAEQEVLASVPDSKQNKEEE